MIEMINDNKKDIYLGVLGILELEIIKDWRNKVPEALRTPFLITSGMQKQFEKDVLNNRQSNHRYFGIYINDEADRLMCTQDQLEFLPSNLVGMGGITNIEWENGLAEISLIIGEKHKDEGYGKKSVELLLHKAFNEMRLDNIYGECYKCNPNIGFWEKIIKKYSAYQTILPNRKFYKSEFYNSLYFNINITNYNNEIGKEELGKTI